MTVRNSVISSDREMIAIQSVVYLYEYLPSNKDTLTFSVMMTLPGYEMRMTAHDYSYVVLSMHRARFFIQEKKNIPSIKSVL